MSNAQKLAAIQLEIDAMPSYEHATQYGEGKEWRKKMQRLMYKREALTPARLYKVIWRDGVRSRGNYPIEVVYTGLSFDEAHTRCDTLNSETRGALGAYSVRKQS
jgi:hypothetical protein